MMVMMWMVVKLTHPIENVLPASQGHPQITMYPEPAFGGDRASHLG